MSGINGFPGSPGRAGPMGEKGDTGRPGLDVSLKSFERILSTNYLFRYVLVILMLLKNQLPFMIGKTWSSWHQGTKRRNGYCILWTERRAR